jgi:hypothetical protein
METILQRFREKVDKLAEETRKEIKEKFVGRGAIVIVEHRGGEKASSKNYIIGIPSDVDKEHLALKTDKIFQVSLMESTTYKGKVISWDLIDPCIEDFERTIFYNDSIRFLTADIIDEIVKDAASFIPRRKKARFIEAKNANTTRKTLSTCKGKESDEQMMTIIDFVETMKTELMKFIKEED